jgi:4-diphosphocytidyl-2-C-methyl-D-erythritol kinase
MGSTLAGERAAVQGRLFFISPAKINVFFRVLHKRNDGLHEIASLYQAINLCDRLVVESSKVDLFTCSDPALATDDTNLVMKALSLFRQHTGVIDPLKIHLEKNIPVQAGLGGGSSNAATALWAFSQIFSTCSSKEELAHLGAKLGSDVPFFFSSGTSYCTGRGEKLRDVSVPTYLENASIWIAKPFFGVSTPEVYSLCKPNLLPQRDPQEALGLFLRGEALFYNDLEMSAFSLYPALKTLKKTLLESGFEHVVMSGSGSSFFCIGQGTPYPIKGVELFQVGLVQSANVSRWYQL